MKSFIFLLTISFPLLAQTGLQDHEDQAERLFNNAATFMVAGKYNEALADYQRIVTQYQNSGWADKALLEMGNYYRIRENDYPRATQYYSQIQEQYPTTDSAKAAYYWKSYILDTTARSHAQLEEAVADLIRMINIYSDNPWKSDGLFLLGKLNMRLHEYNQSLAFFQELEFSAQGRAVVPEALLLSAQITYFNGMTQRSQLMLARLQSRYPDSPQAELAEQHLRLLDKFDRGEPTYELDRGFSGGVPKKYRNPKQVVAARNVVGLLDNRDFHLMGTGDLLPIAPVDADNLVGLCVDSSHQIAFVFSDRVVGLDGQVLFSNLECEGDYLRRIESAAVDSLGRLAVVDSGAKDAVVFDGAGAFLTKLGVNRAVKVRSFLDGFFVLGQEEEMIYRFDGQLQPKGRLGGPFSHVIDFEFDIFGNLYVLQEKGDQLSILDGQQQVRSRLDFKNGGYPFKQAEAVAVDESGAIFLADRRGGALYRFQ